MKALIIRFEGQDVLILNRDYPKQFLLFVEFISQYDETYKLYKNDFDYTVEVKARLGYLTSAMNYINRHL